MRQWVRMLPCVLAVLIGGAASAAPVCDVAMSQPVYIQNELVRISTLRYSNLSESPLPVRLRLQVELPFGLVIDMLDLGANGSMVMPAGFDRILSPVNLFPVSSQPRGTYQLRCVLEDPATGTILVEDTTAFELPEFPDRHPVLLEYSFDDESPDATFSPMGVVVFEEVGTQVQDAARSHCAEWIAEVPVILSATRDEVTFQHMNIETPACTPTVVSDEVSLGSSGTLPYTVTVTSISLHYQPFAAAIHPNGGFADDQPSMFRLIGTIQIGGQTKPFDVLSPAINNIADGGKPSGTFDAVPGTGDIALEHLSLRALTVSVPGNRPPALFETLVNGIPIALRIGGRFSGTLGSEVATPVPIP